MFNFCFCSKSVSGLIFFLVMIATLNLNAQPKDEKSAKADNKIVLQEILAKRQNNRFILITPDELGKLSIVERDTLLASHGPCDTAVSMSIGQTVGGALNPTDCRLDDGSYADFYAFSGTQGQQIRIFMNSSSIDSYLGVANESGSFILEDDDSGGGLSALITATLPETGVYIILANSALPNQFGGYTLSLSGPQPCAFSVSPTTANVPGTGGTFSFTVNTQPECQWTANSPWTFITTNSSGTGTGTVTYTVAQNGSGETRSGSILVGSSPVFTGQQYFTITQPTVACSYSLSPASVSIGAAQSTGSFSVIAPAGCPWSVQSNSGFVSASGSGQGNGTITYTAAYNNGAARAATISVGGQTFTINQAGLNCTYAISPTLINVGRQGATKTVSVITQPGCNWTATSNQSWLVLQNTSGSGTGMVTFRIAAQTESQARSAAVQIYYGFNSTTVWVDQSKVVSNFAYDYDGDGKTDISLFRPSDRVWYVSNSSGGANYTQFGFSTDKISPADFDGDGKTDVAVYRPESGVWFILKSTGAVQYAYFGTAEDVPVPADYNGDGRAEVAVYRPSNGTWYILNSETNQFSSIQFGINTDKPVAADYDGDGKADIAVYRPETGIWFILRSGSGTVEYVQFGINTDKPVQADYDGDGKTDIAVYRPSEGRWYILGTSGGFTTTQFGIVSDIPVAADYDGNGKTDIAVYRPSEGNWYRLKSRDGFDIIRFGLSGDKPTPAAFVY
jgi:hypothetical protein